MESADAVNENDIALSFTVKRRQGPSANSIADRQPPRQHDKRSKAGLSPIWHGGVEHLRASPKQMRLQSAPGQEINRHGMARALFGFTENVCLVRYLPNVVTRTEWVGAPIGISASTRCRRAPTRAPRNAHCQQIRTPRDPGPPSMPIEILALRCTAGRSKCSFSLRTASAIAIRLVRKHSNPQPKPAGLVICLQGKEAYGE